MPLIPQTKLAELYQQACEVELQAFKPGNVSIYADGHDMTVEDFRVSAEVSAGPISNPDYRLGEKIYYAVKATQEAVACNTNLGILLLTAPMLQAVQQMNENGSLREALQKILQNTTVIDADWVFRAISLASPGGLGKSEQQDVHEKARLNLTDAMEIAAGKDRIAYQYISNYTDIFDRAVLWYNAAFSRWSDSGWSALTVYARLLSIYPDSHIERKFGSKYTAWVAAKMKKIDQELSIVVRPESMLPMLYQIDQELKSDGLNPGTTADMTVATVLAVLLLDLVSQND